VRHYAIATAWRHGQLGGYAVFSVRPDVMMLEVRSPERNPADLDAGCNTQLGDGEDW